MNAADIDPSDRELLRRHLAGDREAIDHLIRRHMDMVYAAARRMAGESRAPDVTQAACLLLVQKAKSLASRESVAGWLYRVTGYCAANLKKAEARRQKHEREAAMSAVVSPLESEQIELLGLLDAALAKLSETEREAVLLHHLEQKTYPQAAACLGISQEAARKRADRGIERLRTSFARKGHVASAVAVTGALSSQAMAKAPAAVLTTTLATAHGAAPAAVLGLTKAASSALWWSPVKIMAACLIAAALLTTVTYPAIQQFSSKPIVKLSPASVPGATTQAVAASPPPVEVIDVAALPAFERLRFTHVTVDFDNATPANAARIFGEAVTTPADLDVSALAASGTPLPPLTLHLHDVPLMHALFQFARITESYPTELSAYHLTYRASRADAANIQPHMGVWSVAGPFAFELAQIEKSATRGGTSETFLTLNVYAEPAKRILKYPDAVTIEKFVDSKGQAIEIGRARGANARLVLPLVVPASPGRKIATFRGTATFTLPIESQRLMTEGPDQQASGKAGAMEVEMLPMFKHLQTGATIPLFDMKVRYKRGGLEAQEWASLVPSLQLFPPKVFDAQGHTISSHYVSSSMVKEGENAVVLTFSSPGVPISAPPGSVKNGEPHHYELEVPLAVRNVPAPFEFSNISLP